MTKGGTASETVLQLSVGSGTCAVTASGQKWLKLNVHKIPALTEIETLLVLLNFFFSKSIPDVK